jgi:hypothetical protein
LVVTGSFVAFCAGAVARWPLMILTGVHGVVLSIGTYSTFNGSIAGGEVPPLLSWFGLIHFESIVFTIAASSKGVR